MRELSGIVGPREHARLPQQFRIAATGGGQYRTAARQRLEQRQGEHLIGARMHDTGGGVVRPHQLARRDHAHEAYVQSMRPGPRAERRIELADPAQHQRRSGVTEHREAVEQKVPTLLRLECADTDKEWAITQVVTRSEGAAGSGVRPEQRAVHAVGNHAPRGAAHPRRDAKRFGREPLGQIHGQSHAPVGESGPQVGTRSRCAEAVNDRNSADERSRGRQPEVARLVGDQDVAPGLGQRPVQGPCVLETGMDDIRLTHRYTPFGEPGDESRGNQRPYLVPSVEESPPHLREHSA